MSDITAQVSSSINALTQEFNVITHNLANASTVGYKRRCNSFARLLEEQSGPEQTETTGGIAASAAIDFSQGSLMETGRTLDFALHGKGFFVIETPEGPVYTRNGTFNTDQNGQIVDSSGRIVSGEAGPITVPAGVGQSELYVSGYGSVSAKGTPIGKLRVVDFKDNEGKLVSVGSNCFQMPEKGIEPEAATGAVVKQGYQESSNVETIDELVDMIMVSRLYEANLKFISAKKEAQGSILSVAMA
jgi:flagellar basal body rod protein FlgG